MSETTKAFSERMRSELAKPPRRRSWPLQLASPLLVLLALVYALILGIRRRLLSRRPGQPAYPKRRQAFSQVGAIVSVGNLSVGGTGKSPLVRLLAKEALQEGKLVLVLSRGYGAPKEGRGFFWSLGPSLESFGTLPRLHVSLLADELSELHALLSRERFPEEASLVIAQDPRRTSSLESFTEVLRAARRRPEEVCVLLDDGFQHLACPRDLDLLVSSWAEREAPPYCLPLGLYREGFGSTHRRLIESADVHVWNVSGLTLNEKEKMHPAERGVMEGSPARQAVLDYELGFLDAKGSSLDPGVLCSASHLVTVTGIGSPERFLASVDAHLLSLQKQRPQWLAVHLPDHSPFLPSSVRGLASATADGERVPLLLTMKDWCRWKDDPAFLDFATAFDCVRVVVEPRLRWRGETGESSVARTLWQRAFQVASQSLAG